MRVVLPAKSGELEESVLAALCFCGKFLCNVGWGRENWTEGGEGGW